MKLTLRPNACSGVNAGLVAQAKAPAVRPPALSVSLWLALAYFSAELISENSWLRRVPRLPRIVTSAIAINEAISAYSMAVAPDSSDAKSLTNFMCDAPNNWDGSAVAAFVIARRF